MKGKRNVEARTEIEEYGVWCKNYSLT